MRERFAIFAKTDAERYAAATEWLFAHGLTRVAYICPANRKADVVTALAGLDAMVVTFEEMPKKEPFLRLVAFVNGKTGVIIDGSVRYNSVNSSKFRPIHHVCKATPFRLVLDIAPFYGITRSIYFPYSYLDRAILGYQHWYAFRPNNLEEAVNGEQVDAHDHQLLAGKVAPHSAISYRRLLAERRQFVECRTTPAEEAAYAAKKADLFEKWKTPGPIITRLADFTHAMESRMAAYRDLVSGLKGGVLVLTNLADAKVAGSAKKARMEAALVGRPVTARSFYDTPTDAGSFDHVVYLESPIVNGYLLLDFEARIRPDAQVWHFVGDAKVDLFLSSRIREEMNAMNDFAGKLYEAIHGP